MVEELAMNSIRQLRKALTAAWKTFEDELGIDASDALLRTKCFN